MAEKTTFLPHNPGRCKITRECGNFFLEQMRFMDDNINRSLAGLTVRPQASSDVWVFLYADTLALWLATAFT
jgi:hypothetical protein